ncbi:GNAT family N-acetyltransferase [Clostridioides difficile]|uniref:GNAT family N-acetyltransferase n=1 Tax=Clostridioides difficile TaxID=1496 RepID=UPI00202FA452|nr:GNAT family N-acetyltransferase [Clostridioides difficile]MCM0747099.1 GNAT family N-acetyltransferase [Clostridioides difficile]
MQGQTVHIVSQAIRYIEDNLHDKLDLDMVALALHYSKYHLHRLFTKTVGLTIHEYAKRRQLTEAAKLLVFSKKPIIEIAFMSGYESQQAFTDIFKAMYKTSPAEFRGNEHFYPLQLEIHLKEEVIKMDFTKDDIKFAMPADVDDWMELVKLTVDGYPCLDKTEYLENLHLYIADKKALILRDEGMAVGIMGFSADTGSIDFFAVHPQYRNLGIAKLFLDKLVDELLCGREITLTTYRAGDKADTGYREEYRRLGFAEQELLVEYGYPTQRFVLLPEDKEEVKYDRSTEESTS